MYSKHCITALIFTTLFFAACEPSVKDGLSYDEYVKMAREYQKSDDYDRAIAAGKKAVSIKPQNGETHYLLAMLYYEGWRKSLDTAQMKALQEAMQNPNKRQYASEIEELKKFGLKAEWEPLSNQEFKETIKYDPKNWFARYMIATDLFNSKHFKEAIDEYKEVIEINPNYANAHGLIGESYFKLGDFKSAVLNLETAVKLDPGVENYLQLGLAYKRINNWNKYAAIAEKLKGMDKSRYEQLMTD